MQRAISITLAWEVHQNGVSNSQPAIARRFPVPARGTISREADVYLDSALTSAEVWNFLLRCLPLRFSGSMPLIQTDGEASSRVSSSPASGRSLSVTACRVPTRRTGTHAVWVKPSLRVLTKSCTRSAGGAEFLGWDVYRPGDIPTLQWQADAVLVGYHYHRPHLGLAALRPPLERRSDLKQGNWKLAT